MQKNALGLINHVAFVLDASISMSNLEKKVVQVADEQIAYLARRSKELDQETRVTVYVFSDDVRCVIYDKDVLRMPSLADLYRVDGNTALMAATIQSQRELAQTAQLYGDHSFLTFVLTDGQENVSHRGHNPMYRTPAEFTRALKTMIETQEDHWTLAVLVPDQMGKREAMQCGFPKDNIAIWDATSTKGLEEAGEVIRQATDTYMTNRASGIRGSRSVFSTGSDAVNSSTIKQAALKPMKASDYVLVPVTTDTPIKQWVEEQVGRKYQLGKGYYQLSKLETIQGNKALAVVEKATGQVYVGDQVRDILGLNSLTVRVKPNHNEDYKIFVQSTSVNRKLKAGTQLLLMN